MSALDLSAVMDAIADAIVEAEIVPSAFAWPAESVATPCAIVGFPQEIEIGVTFNRGADVAVIPLYLVAGRNDPKTMRDTISAWIAGANAVVEALEPDLGGVVAVASVTKVGISFIEVGGVPMAAAEFSVEVTS